METWRFNIWAIFCRHAWSQTYGWTPYDFICEWFLKDTDMAHRQRPHANGWLALSWPSRSLSGIVFVPARTRSYEMCWCPSICLCIHRHIQKYGQLYISIILFYILHGGQCPQCMRVEGSTWKDNWTSIISVPATHNFMLATETSMIPVLLMSAGVSWGIWWSGIVEPWHRHRYVGPVTSH